MLGRGIGISDEKLAHLGDDPLPDGVYTTAEAAVIRYAQRSTSRLPIDEATYWEIRRQYEAGAYEYQIREGSYRLQDYLDKLAVHKRDRVQPAPESM